jgi:glucose/arabinose dehydrogenase/mono/diheme cytochrome c family protein
MAVVDYALEMRSITTTFAAVALSTVSLFAALPTPDPDDGGITLPPGFRALVYADNLVASRRSGFTQENLRGLAVAPNGDVYAKGLRGQIFALRDTNSDGRADVIEQFGPGDGGTIIMFHNGYLYHASSKALYRYKYIPGELVPSSPLETIVRDLPNQSGGHDQKPFAFDESGHVIIEVGSPQNDYSQGDRQRGAKGYSPEEVAKFQETYGGFWQFDADKTNQTFTDGTRFATGERHSVALVWHPVSKNFFMCMMGRDQLNTVDSADYDALDNAERVAEEFHLMKQGANLGWPYSYWDPIKNARMLSPEYGGDNRKREDNPAYDKPIIGFPGHWAPLQMCVYDGTQFPEHYRNGFFLAFHGSWNRSPQPQAGYRVVFIPVDAGGMPGNRYDNFAMGFAGGDETNIRNARYRPCGVAVGPDGSLYISETEKGRIWRVIYTGETNAPMAGRQFVATATAQSYPPILADTPGGKAFAQVCAACHMPNGSGVPGMQPPLVGSSVIAGDTTQLINVLLQGPAKALPADRPKFQNVMPPFGPVYKDDDIASLINYLRANFAPNAPKVSPAEVAAQRAKP